MSELSLEIIEDPSQNDIQVLYDGLESHYRALGNVELRNEVNLAVFIRDESGKILGGIQGCTYWGWLHINGLWVSERLRGCGYGKRLMATAEREAVKRGCCKAIVDTHSFQARGFYEKLGYRVFGVLDDFPTSHQRYYLCKDEL